MFYKIMKIFAEIFVVSILVSCDAQILESKGKICLRRARSIKEEVISLQAFHLYLGPIGQKARDLRRLVHLGFPVPQGFVITSEGFRRYRESKEIPSYIWEGVIRELRRLEEDTGKRFGDSSNPLLLSVRGAPPKAMPGILATILNVGINDSTLEGLIEMAGGGRYDIPAYSVLHQIPVFYKGSPCKVAVFYSIRDSGKERRFFGKDLHEWLKERGLKIGDIWDEDIPEQERTLWNARLFPIDDLDLTLHLKDEPDEFKEVREKWLKADRLSLEDILNYVSFEAILKTRSLLLRKIEENKMTYFGSRCYEFNFSFVENKMSSSGKGDEKCEILIG